MGETYILLEKIITKKSGNIIVKYEIFKRFLWIFYKPVRYNVAEKLYWNYVKLKDFFPGFRPRYQFSSKDDALDVLKSLRFLRTEECLDIFPVLIPDRYNRTCNLYWASSKELWKERWSEIYKYKCYKVFNNAFQSFKDLKTIDVKIKEVYYEES